MYLSCGAGGDGGLLSEMKMMKKQQAFGAAPPRKDLMKECLVGAAPEAWAARCAAPYGGNALARQAVAARTPVLGFLAQPAAVLTRLQLGPGGVLQLSADQLQQLLSEAAGLTAEGTTVGQSVWDVTGCRVVSAAVFDPRTLGQFGAAWCAVQGQQQQQQDAQGETAGEASGVSSCLPPAAVRDMGLDRPVDPGLVSALVSCHCSGVTCSTRQTLCAMSVPSLMLCLLCGFRQCLSISRLPAGVSALQSCHVVVLREPGASLSLQNPEAAEAGVYGSLQQVYHLLAGFMKAAESGVTWPMGLYAGYE